MKIAIVHTSADSSRGGAETSIVEMSAALANLRHEVTLVTPDAGRDGGFPRGLRTAGLPARGFGRTGRLLNFLENAGAYCRATGFDIVHAVVPLNGCDVYQPRGGTYAATQAANLELLSSPAQRRFKSCFARLNQKQWQLRRLETKLLSVNPPFVAAVSELGRSQITDLVPNFPQERLHTVFNACDTARIAPRTPESTARARQTLTITPETDVLLFIAHNFRLKGLRELLQALALTQSSDRGPILLVAGRDRTPRYQRLAETLGLAKRVRFLGPTAPISMLYAAADGLVHPTWYDPCSRVVLEAICHGLPVITTRRNGAAEVLDAASGFVIDSPADVHELSNCIQQVLKPAARIAAVQFAPIVRATVSMERHARDLLRLYEQAASTRAN